MKKLLYTEIIDTTVATSGGSAVARGAVGAALLGPVGLLAAATAKKQHETVFALHWDNGKVDYKTVKTGGVSYDVYMKQLRKTEG